MGRQGYLAFREDLIRAASLVELQGQSVALRSASFKHTALSVSSLHTENDNATMSWCKIPADAIKELGDIYIPSPREKKQDLPRRFNRYSFRANDNPIKTVN